MSFLPLALVILAAFIHATWNLLSKRAASAGPAFVCAYSFVACVVYLPWLGWVLAHNETARSLPIAGCIFVSAVLHLAYSLCLQRGYQVADLSVVYPVARGTGPTLASIGAFILLGEMPSALGILGLLAVVAGIGFISNSGRHVSVPPAGRPGWGALGPGYRFADRGLHRGRWIRRQDTRHSSGRTRLVRKSAALPDAGAARAVEPCSRQDSDERPLASGDRGRGALAPVVHTRAQRHRYGSPAQPGGAGARNVDDGELPCLEC